MSRIRVMHLTDTLARGGKECVAVNMANLLPSEHYRTYLCTTRRDGSLANSVAAHVMRLRLERRCRFDLGAARRLVAFIKANNIHVLHAHGLSLFMAWIAAHFAPHPVVVWHGHSHPGARQAWLYRLMAGGIDGVIAVSQPLADWAQCRLGVPAERIWYIPNFVCLPEGPEEPPPLPGTAGKRIVCVANFRAQKDHITLVRAMALVKPRVSGAHLLLVGAPADLEYFDVVGNEIVRLGLDKTVSVLGERADVSGILRTCDIGVLSSASEGLPLALIEYGLNGLPVVATRVGQCAEVLDEGRAGILVPPGAPGQLAEALVMLLHSPSLCLALARRFRDRVERLYSSGPVIEQICRVYDVVLGPKQ